MGHRSGKVRLPRPTSQPLSYAANLLLLTVSHRVDWFSQCFIGNATKRQFEQHDQILAMYRRAIFKIWLEPDSTGYRTNYPAGTGTGYMNTCCIAIFWFFCVLWILKVLFPMFVVFSFVCLHTAQLFIKISFSALSGSTGVWCSVMTAGSRFYGWTNCQKGIITIRLRYPVPGTILAGTGAGTGF